MKLTECATSASVVPRRSISCARCLGSWLLLALAGCTITREYVGTPLRADPNQLIQPGVTDMAQILADFGPPERILRNTIGDVFVYRFRRRNSEVLSIEEPVITNLEIFTYSRMREKEDRLVVLFDSGGRVRSFGYIRGTAELDDDKDRKDADALPKAEH